MAHEHCPSPELQLRSRGIATAFTLATSIGHVMTLWPCKNLSSGGGDKRDRIVSMTFGAIVIGRNDGKAVPTMPAVIKPRQLQAIKASGLS